VKLLPLIEHAVKGPVWDCRMCGQCVLHSTGMTCPMTCPKTLRNGPCGGVREDGRCEVKPEMECVWAKAERRSHHPMNPSAWEAHFSHLRPPVDNTLRGTASWANLLTRRDQQTPPGWAGALAPADHDPQPSLGEVDDIDSLDEGFDARKAPA
jgi:hypothetical protein